jgi:uncharacterized repeat protein (TIGR01451 family)
MNVRHSVYLALSLSAFLPLSLLGCAAGNSGSGSGSTTPPVTAATITSIAPAATPVGAAATTLTVNGTNFISTSVVQVAGVSEATTYVSATQLQASIPASLLASAALLPVAVLNGSTTSIATPINLEVDNPAPVISSFNPAAFASGSAAAPVTIAGSGFVPTSSVQINGSARPTTYVSGTQITATLTVADLATATSLSMKVVNPAPGGGASAASSIAVNNPAPAGLTLSPATGIVGAAATTITVGGTGFISSSVVNVNGSARATTFVDATHLTFSLTATDQATAATLAITVTNAAPGGGTSPAASLVVSPPTPTPVITTVNPTQFIISSSPAAMQVVGTGFTTKSVVQWNGTSLATSYYTNGSTVIYLLATVPASLLTTATTASVTVSSPTANPGTSNAISVSVTNPPPPTITSISPNYGPIGVATPITVYGTSFNAASTISFNGSPLTTTYTSSTTLTATVPASAISTPGNGSITVTTPAPGGGTAAAQVFTAYVPLVSNSGIFNPADGLYYVSVPSSAGTQYGNSIVSVDPNTGAIGTPIPVGSEPDKLALSSDGTILWVGLDGASAIRQVNLTTKTAGLQISLGGNTGIYATPPTVLALAALPGSPNSVIVSTSSNIAIYDNGVLRGTASSSYPYYSGNAIQVDGTKSEIYVASSNSYYVFTYSATGLTLKTSASTGTYANYSSSDDLLAAGGRIYTDAGYVYDVESGALLGTFYNTGTTVATGPTVADTALNKAFILDYPTNYTYNYSQIQAFNTTDFTSASASIIPVNGVSSSAGGASSNPSHLIRWGTNGLAFRAPNGIFSLRSNLVKDLSTTIADLGVTIAATGSNASGSNSTYTATVANAGPSGSTNVVFTGLLPASTVLISATPSQGTCVSGNVLTCNLGAIASGSSVTVAVVALQTAPGSTTFTAQVSGSETDSNLSNNQATSTLTITGSAYNVVPTLTTISPAAILAGSTDTVVTVVGTGFNSTTKVLLNGSSLSTSVSTSTQLTAIVPAANLATLGWAALTVSNPAPGGGTSAPTPLSIFNVITLGVNHILYDPFTRKLYASVGSGSATVTGNSIAAITPETGAIGTPVSIGSQPTKMALSDDGQVLYTILTGSSSLSRFNMLTQQAAFTYTPAPSTYSASTNGFRDIAVLAGSEDTIALDLGYTSGLGLYDFNPTSQTASLRGAVTGLYSGSSLQFLNPSTLLVFNIDTWQTLDKYPITAAGFSYYNQSQFTSSTLNHFGLFKLNGGLAFANNGGLADPSTNPATQLGVYPALNSYSYNQIVAPDTSLSRVFFLGSTGLTTNSSNPDGIIAYNQSTFLPTSAVSLNMAAIEGANTSYTAVDLIRWGQDGLAALTSGGHIYIVRGPVVVSQLLNQNTAATLTSALPSNIAHGAGNTLLTITGSGFIQGAAVTWNGTYRTTTWVDAGHLTVAIPAGDLATAGSATIVVTNPGATASSSITFTIN